MVFFLCFFDNFRSSANPLRSSTAQIHKVNQNQQRSGKQKVIHKKSLFFLKKGVEKVYFRM